MRVVVVGTIVADTIEHGDGKVTESLGGIAHSVSVLSALGGDRHQIVPVCRVGRDCRARVEEWAGGLAGVTLEAVQWSRRPNPRVRLCYAEADGAGERVERLEDAPAPLLPEELRCAGGADVALVNCITGTDCRPETLAAARRASSWLYLDVHSLAFGTDAGGRRYYRSRNDWHRWLGAPDVLQCNLAEAATVCGLPSTAPAEAVIAAVRAWMSRAASDAAAVEEHGAARERRRPSRPAAATPGVWLVTLGAAGVAVVQRSAGSVVVARVGAPRVDAVDPTGAGDAFGAAYVAGLPDHDDAVVAAGHAARVASAAATIPGAPTPSAMQRALARLAD